MMRDLRELQSYGRFLSFAIMALKLSARSRN
jgi:hypothetical protein